MNMKIIDKGTGGRSRPIHKTGKVRAESRLDARLQVVAAIDRQVAEIERTFTARWEW